MSLAPVTIKDQNGVIRIKMGVWDDEEEVIIRVIYDTRQGGRLIQGDRPYGYYQTEYAYRPGHKESERWAMRCGNNFTMGFWHVADERVPNLVRLAVAVSVVT